MQPAPAACPPQLVVELEDEPPVAGSVVVPTTPAGREATAEFLTGEADARAWGRRGWDRARLAKETCERER